MSVIKRLPVMAFLACVLASSILPAAADKTYYVSAQIPYTVIEGDFDNIHFPEVDAGSGIGVSFGYWAKPNIAMELRWSVTKHDSLGALIDQKEISLNGRYLFLGESSVKPYLLFGYGDFSLGDSSLMFGGKGIRFGAGVDSYVGPTMSFGVALIRTVPTYDTVKKSDGPVSLVGELRGDSTSIIFDIKYHF